MEDLPVGSDITLKVVDDKKGECNGCFFYEFSSDMYAETCTGLIRRSTGRKDGESVQFKRVKYYGKRD